MFVGIVPLVVVLMTAFNAVIAWIGTERIENFGKFASQEGILFLPLRYLVLPVVSVFVLTTPMAYTMGRFLPEKYKPAFYDSAVSFVHPPLGILPHVNPGELFVWAGIATGVATGYGDAAVTDLAVRYLLVGLVVIVPVSAFFVGPSESILLGRTFRGFASFAPNRPCDSNTTNRANSVTDSNSKTFAPISSPSSSITPRAPLSGRIQPSCVATAAAYPPIANTKATAELAQARS